MRCHGYAFQAPLLHTWTKDTVPVMSDDTKYDVPNLYNVEVPASELKRILSTELSTRSWLSDISFYVMARLLTVSRAMLYSSVEFCPSNLSKPSKT